MDKNQAEKLWSEEKYHVMFHSQYHYNAIRAAMKDAMYDKVPSLIADALTVTPTIGSQRNTIMHMWGYFKKQATFDEKALYQQLLQADEFEELLKLLKELALKYDVKYLLESRVLRG